MRRRSVRTTSLLAGAGLVVSAALGAVGSAQAAPTGTAVAKAPAYDDYVALGDSYSAGPLIPAQRADPLGCLRSTNNYPAFLAMYFQVGSYTDVTCSGAETGDLRAPQETIVPGPPPPPQLDALSKDTDLVTLGLGGNDYGLFGSMIEECERVAASDPDGAPCRDLYTVDGVDTKKRDARRIQVRIGRSLAAIKARAPRADVYVVGYPRLLPLRGTCDDVPFAAGDYRWGNQVERVLNRSLRRAAENRGATYIDLYPASLGHDACAGRKAWINGHQIKPLRAANFHPFLRGMRGAAQATYRQITGKRAPTRPRVALPPGVPTPPLADRGAVPEFLG